MSRDYPRLPEITPDQAEQGVFLYMSHKCKRLLGYAPTELSSSRAMIGTIRDEPRYAEMGRDEPR